LSKDNCNYLICLKQWEYLTSYCQWGDLHISNVLAESAILPFAVDRKAWLFADTPQGACASATCYSLIETAKVNELELDPYAISTIYWNTLLRLIRWRSGRLFCHGMCLWRKFK